MKSQVIIVGLLIYVYLHADAQILSLNSVSTRVIGGSPTTIEIYPVIAQLLLDSWGNGKFEQYCAGTVITARHVLTSAHCFQYSKDTRMNYTLPKFWKIRVGSTYRSRGGKIEDIKALIKHPSFDNKYYINDVAIAIVAHAIPFSNNIRQGTISQSYSEVKTNSVVTLIGWGATKVGGPQSEQLMKVNMKIIDQKICMDRYKGVGAIIRDSMLCAGKLDGGGLDGCYGDSGGPLIYNGLIIGLVSFGYACGHHYYPGVYTKISHFSDWIVKTASENS